MNHPIDEPCPPGCPTRDDEIADYVTGWLAAYGHNSTVTAADVARVRTTAAEARGWIQRQIAEVDSSWQ